MSILQKIFGTKKAKLNKPVSINNCKSVISWGNSFFDLEKRKTVTHKVTDILVNSMSSMVTVIIDDGITVSSVKFSMEHAQEIGFINIEALQNYCK